MKRFLWLFLMFFALPAVAVCQTTTVSIQVTDSGSVAWANGTYQFTLVAQAGSTWPGGGLANAYPTAPGALSSSGAASQSVPSSVTITPGPAFWNLTVCPSSAITMQGSGCYTKQYSTSGSTQTINIVPPAISIPVPTVSTVINPVVAYADAEISGGWINFVYNQYSASGSPTGRICTAISNNSCSTWAAYSGGSGNGITALAGDVTAAGPGSATATLATVNSNVGAFMCSNVTANAKGLITAIATGTCGGTPGGSANAVQINNSGSFGPACTPPATQGTFNLSYVVPSTSTVAPTCPQVGSIPRSLNASNYTSANTALYSDNILGVLVDYLTPAAATLSLPNPTALNNASYALPVTNYSQYGTLIAPTGSPLFTINQNAQSWLPPGGSETLRVDPFNANNWIGTLSGLDGVEYTTWGIPFVVPTIAVTGGTQGSYTCPNNCQTYAVTIYEANGLTRTVYVSTSAGPTTFSGTVNVSPYNTITLPNPNSSDPIVSCTIWRALGQNPVTWQGSIGSTTNCASGWTFQDYGQSVITAGAPPADTSGVITAGALAGNGIVNAPLANIENTVGSFQPVAGNYALNVGYGNCPASLIQSTFYSVQFTNGYSTAMQACINGSTTIPGSHGGYGVNQIDAGLFIALSGNSANTVGVSAYSLATSASAGFLTGVNEVCQDNYPLFSVGATFNCNEIDVQPTGTAASQYAAHFGAGLNINFFPNQNQSSFGIYPGNGIDIATGYPGTTWQFGIDFRLASVSTAILVNPAGTATSSANYGPPIMLNGEMNYWNGSANATENISLTGGVSGGTNPNTAYWRFAGSGAPAGGSFLIEAGPGVSYALNHSDNTYNVLAAPSVTGANYTDTFPAATGTVAVYTGTPVAGDCSSWSGTVPVLVDFGQACSSFLGIQNGAVTVTPSSGLVNFAAGSNVTLTTSGNTVTIAASATGATAWSAITAGANTATGEFSTQASASATAPGWLFNGTPTTTSAYWPLVYISPSGATNPTFSNNGTMLAINAASGFAGFAIDVFAANGGSATFNVTQAGAVYAATGITTGANYQFNFNGSSSIKAPSNGVVELLNTAGTSFTRLDFGGTTSSFVALCTSGTTLTVCDASGGSAGILSSPIYQSTATQTTVSCSTSGTAIFSEPEQGSSDKRVVIHVTACVGTASYTYPAAFTNTPSVYASNNVAASIATSVSATAVTVTGATTTGSLLLEDY